MGVRKMTEKMEWQKKMKNERLAAYTATGFISLLDAV
jgi:hypothetical protein